MKARERMEEAKRLVKELEVLKERSAGSEIHVRLYIVRGMPLEWQIKCYFWAAIACIFLAFTVFDSAILFWAGVVMLVVTAVLECASLNESKEEISCTKRSVAKLRKEVDMYRRELEKFEERKEEAEKARRKYSKLEQLIVDELGGEMDIYPKGDQLQIYVKIGCMMKELPLNDGNCEQQIWELVAVARKLHGWAVELKEELGVV